jgi:hypothetical protein
MADESQYEVDSMTTIALEEEKTSSRSLSYTLKDFCTTVQCARKKLIINIPTIYSQTIKHLIF